MPLTNLYELIREDREETTRLLAQVETASRFLQPALRDALTDYAKSLRESISAASEVLSRGASKASA